AKTGFFIHLKVVDEFGDTVFPVFWDDNYISILPNEKRTIKCLIPENLFLNGKTKLLISGWNVSEQSHILEKN
ncbi:MAG: hypothetical protein WAV86_09760, partial [Lutibacter sp.]